MAKLTAERVLKIVEMARSGAMTKPEIAKHFGIAKAQVWRILNGERWKHITGL
jgi:DNA invertase Pin-like site-specific DNA recombinase